MVILAIWQSSKISEFRTLKIGATMGHDDCVVAITKQEIMRMDMIVFDGEKDDALAFLRELRLKIQANTIKGLKSHLDG